MANKLSNIARNIKRLRKEKELSQDRLSKIADVAHPTIIKIESGAIKNPTVETAQKIACALGVRIDDLLK